MLNCCYHLLVGANEQQSAEAMKQEFHTIHSEINSLKPKVQSEFERTRAEMVEYRMEMKEMKKSMLEMHKQLTMLTDICKSAVTARCHHSEHCSSCGLLRNSCSSNNISSNTGYSTSARNVDELQCPSVVPRKTFECVEPKTENGDQNKRTLPEHNMNNTESKINGIELHRKTAAAPHNLQQTYPFRATPGLTSTHESDKASVFARERASVMSVSESGVKVNENYNNNIVSDCYSGLSPNRSKSFAMSSNELWKSSDHGNPWNTNEASHRANRFPKEAVKELSKITARDNTTKDQKQEEVDLYEYSL